MDERNGRLAAERSGRAGFGEVASIVGWTALGVVVVNLLAVLLLKVYPLNVSYLITDAKWDLLREMPAEVDWLILGDSSCNQGLAPEVVSRELGGSAVNLCTVGDFGLLGAALMLKSYVGRFGSAPNVILMYSYVSLTREINPLALSLLPFDKIPETRDLRYVQKVVRWFSTRLLPLYSQNISLGALLRHPVTAVRIMNRYHVQDDGFTRIEVGDPSPEARNADIRDHLRLVRTAEPRLDGQNRKLLELLVTQAREEGFRLYLFSAPVVEDITGDSRFREFFAGVWRDVRSIVGDRPEVRLFADPIVFAGREMESVDHLAPRAAVTFSSLIAATIREENRAGYRESGE